ncbi:hypothetical protein [Kibdelosporangium aridum]|uniref:hypothetical protein n=1 Tax=Kibdelosporangium aridum TaxID=2030 RepID=UPI00190EBF61|nr:hypothetical protein [Kibdelosporangium aridum]
MAHIFGGEIGTQVVAELITPVHVLPADLCEPGEHRRLTDQAGEGRQNRAVQREATQGTIYGGRRPKSSKTPSRPGARNLTEFFAAVDTELNAESAAAPKVQCNDRDILNLLSKRAKVLHLGPANYCWFMDPSRAPLPQTGRQRARPPCPA